MENIVNIIEGIATILAILISAIFAFRFYVHFTTKIELRISHEWADRKKKKVILKFEIENKSHVWARVTNIYLQILEYDKNQFSILSEWVPFSQSEVQSNEQSVVWKEPEVICKTTKRIYPNEIVRVERLYTCPENKILHVGLQLQVKYGKILSKKIFNHADRWTTTKIIYPPVEN
jgi:hypothetical protein